MSTVSLKLAMGPRIPVPLPPSFMEAVKEVEVIHNDEQQSGFQITFTAGRHSLAGRSDYPLLKSPLLKPFNRVIISVEIKAVPKMIMDGVITHVQLIPGSQPGTDKVVVMGKDLSVWMDREEKKVQYPEQNDYIIVNSILDRYAHYALPEVIEPPVLDTPLDTNRIPMQNGTDLAFLYQLAERYEYVFYVAPGILPFQNIAYWGPPKYSGLPQKGLSVNMGHLTTVNSIQFQYDALLAKSYSGELLDRSSQNKLSLRALHSSRKPLSEDGLINTTAYKAIIDAALAGLTFSQAQALAQAKTEKSRKRIVTVTGDIDVTRYGTILQARSLVGLRGAGTNYDGLYYVKEVSHTIRPGQYQQKFVLTRDGTGTSVSAIL